jgi:hypothetical protein
MRHMATISLVLGIACGGGHPAELRTQEYPIGSRWNARLASPAGMVGVLQVTGTAWMAEGKNPDETRAVIAIQNAVPGSRYPWHIHQGRCGSAGGVLGPADQYGVLEVEDDGKASRSVTLPGAPPANGNYLVDVHAALQNPATIVSCGNLAPPVR